MVGHAGEGGHRLLGAAQPSADPLGALPEWVTMVRAPNPGPMTLDGTNTWILRKPGARDCLVIDPGPLLEGHLRAVAAHGPVAMILLTHGHPDHRDGLARLTELTGAPIAPAGSAGGDAVLDAGTAGVRIRAIATPGHTSDSICYIASVDGAQAVLTGDTILGRGTTVVAHPDGDLSDYLDSLRRLAALGAIPVLPGHGPALADCGAAARFYLDHRLARLDQVRSALRAGAEEPADVVAAVYADVDPALWPAAELSVRAQLAYLRQLAQQRQPADQGQRESVDPTRRLDRP